MIWYTLPIDKGVSWEGHLSGFITGLCIAISLKSSLKKAPKYDWEQRHFKPENDAFLKQFDADGYFFELPKQEDIEPKKAPVDYQTSALMHLDIRYSFKSNNEF